MSGAIPPLPHYAFMAWCLVAKKHRDFTINVLIPGRAVSMRMLTELKRRRGNVLKPLNFLKL
jgi:hypothetical protein